MIKLIGKLFGKHYHDWEYLDIIGITWQRRRCNTCHKIEIISQFS